MRRVLAVATYFLLLGLSLRRLARLRGFAAGEVVAGMIV